MSVITREILKQYITCEDPATRNKFYNLLDSFWHKVEGKIIKSYTKDAQGVITGITTVDKDGATETVAFPVMPSSKPISFIENLQETLGNLVTKVPGKGLSTNDLTTELLQKLNALQNYQHPEFHQISEIEGLLLALEGKQPSAPEGYGFSQEDFTSVLKSKLEAYNIWHYGNPVNDLLELAAITTENYTNKQRRYVHTEGCDYFYHSDLNAGDIAPNDQVDGTGFWVKGVNSTEVIDNLTSNSTSKALAANQGRILKGLLDALDLKFADYLLLTEKGAAGGVAVLDGNGHIVESQLGDLAITDTITPIETSLTAFVANAGNYEFQRGDLIIIDDGQENVKHYIYKSGDKSLEANYSQLNATKLPISAIIGLQAELDNRARLDVVNTFQSRQTMAGGMLSHNNIQIFNPTTGDTGEVNLQPNGAIRFSKDRNTWFEFLYSYASAGVRSFSLPDKSGTIALVEDFESLAPKTKPTKTITNTSQYTAVLEDKDKFLVFTNPIDFIIPSGIFSADDEIEARNKANGDVTVVDGSGMTVQVVSSQSKKAPQYAFFGLRFESASLCGLLGQLKPI
jgi:hypothetical protein